MSNNARMHGARPRALAILFAIVLSVPVGFVPSIAAHAGDDGDHGDNVDDSGFWNTVHGFTTKLGFRHVFYYDTDEAILPIVNWGYDPSDLSNTMRATESGPDTSGILFDDIPTNQVITGRTVYFQITDALSGEVSPIHTFTQGNAYRSDNSDGIYELNMVVAVDTEALPEEVPIDQGLLGMAKMMDIAAERIWDATDGYVRVDEVLITDVNADHPINQPFGPGIVCAGRGATADHQPGITMFDTVLQTTVPFDSHTYSYAVDSACTSIYLGRVGQLVIPWIDDLHAGAVQAHEMAHYFFGAPDLYDINDSSRGCWVGVSGAPDNAAGRYDISLMSNKFDWNGGRWRGSEFDRGATTPCDYMGNQDTWTSMVARYGDIPIDGRNGDGQPVHSDSTYNQARGNPDGGALDIWILDQTPGASSLVHWLESTAADIIVDVTGPVQGEAGEFLAFSATASGGTAPYTFSWDFGDSSAPSQGASVTHAFGSSGVYTVTVTATDDNGNVGSAQTTATVNQATEGPFVSITSPGDGASVRGPTSISGIAGHTGDNNTTDLSFSGLEDASVSGTTASLSWGLATGGTPPYEYLVYTGQSGSVDLTTPIQTLSGVSTQVSGLTPGEEACFIVRAKDSTGTLDDNTAELCVLPTISYETLRFYYHGGDKAPITAPDGTPEPTTGPVGGGMTTGIGTTPRKAALGGGSDSGLGGVTLDDIKGRYNAVFETEPLTGDLILAGGTQTLTPRGGTPTEFAAGIKTNTCVENPAALTGRFYGDVFIVDEDDEATMVLTSGAIQWADFLVGCNEHYLMWATESTSGLTVPQGSRLVMAMTPDGLQANAQAILNYDGADDYESFLEITAAFTAGPQSTLITDPVNDARTAEADVTKVTLAAASDLTVTIHVDDLDNPADTDDDPQGAGTTFFSVLFEVDGTQHEFQADSWQGILGGVWHPQGDGGGGAYCDVCTSSYDDGADTVTITIPAAYLGIPSGTSVTNLFVETHNNLGAVYVRDDRAPDMGGRDFTWSIHAPELPDGTTLYLDADGSDLVGIGKLVAGRELPTMSLALPERAAPATAMKRGESFLAVSDGIGGATLGDGDVETAEIVPTRLHVETVALPGSSEGFTAALAAYGPTGRVDLARFSSDVPLSSSPRAVAVDIDFELGSAIDLIGGEETKLELGVFDANGDLSLAPGTRLALEFEALFGDDAGAFIVHYDGATAPSRITLPIPSFVIGGPVFNGSPGGERISDEDDPQELPAGYESVDLVNGFIDSDGTDLTFSVQVHGFDPSLPAPGTAEQSWEYWFDHASGTYGIWISSDGPSDISLDGSVHFLGATGWTTLQAGFPVTVDGNVLSVTVPLSVIKQGADPAPQPGDEFSGTELRSRAVVGVILPTLDCAPGGGPETTLFVCGPGNNYVIPDPDQDTPPTVSSLAVDIQHDSAPAEVLFTGTVAAGTNPLDTVTLDLGDGSDPITLGVLGDNTFAHTAVYETGGSFSAIVTAEDTEGLTGNAAISVDIGAAGEGVFLNIDGSIVHASAEVADWTEWSALYDFSSYEPGTEIGIEAVYFDGALESDPDTITVTVLDGGTLAITSPTPGAHLQPEAQTISGTTSDSSGDPGQGGSGSSNGMWDLDKLYDHDDDRLSDDLEEILASDGQETVRIHVALNHAATQADADRLMARTGAEYAYAIQAVDAVSLEGVPKWAVRPLVNLDDVVFVELNAPAVTTADVAIAAGKARWSTTYSDECVWGGAGCLGYTGAGVGYANFDGGVRATHESFEWQQYAPPGASATDSKEVLYLDPWNGDPTVQAHANHATATAGIAVGTGGPSGTFPGVAPGADLINVRTNKEIGGATGNSVETRTCQSVDGILANRLSHNIRVASLSYGLAAPLSRAVEDACVTSAVDQGIVMIISAGNLGSMGSPASAAGAIVVGNQDDFATVTRLDDTPCHGGSVHRNPGSTSFPICGASGFIGDGTKTIGKPDLSAPGTGITLPTNGGDRTYASTSGTSFSAPFVAGVVALMTEANPALGPAAIEEILEITASIGDLPPAGAWAPYVGHGFVDAHAAVQEAIDRGGGQDLSVSVAGPLTTAPGVTIDLNAVVTGGAPPNTYLWDFGDGQTSTDPAPSHGWALEGTYTVTLTVTDAASEVASDSTTVTVTDQLASGITTPSAGSTVSGTIPVTGSSFFPGSSVGKPFDVDDPVWTDAANDLTFIGAATPQHEPLDIIAAYAWGDAGPTDPDFNLGLGLVDVPPFPANTQYLRYNIEFTFEDKDYRVSTFADPINSVEGGGDGTTPIGIMYERNTAATGGWTNGQDIEVEWDADADVIKFTVPKDRVANNAAEVIGDNGVVGNFIATASSGATVVFQSIGIATHDSSSPPDGFQLTVNPTAGDPHTLVQFGAVAPVRVDGESWSLNVDTTQVLDGPTVISAIATDGLGSFSDPALVSVNVDNGGGGGDPFVTIDTPGASEIVDGTLGFTGTAGLSGSGGGGSSSSVELIPATLFGKAPMHFKVQVDADGPVRSWILDFGDGTVLRGLGDPTDLYHHVYATPGDHQVVMTVFDALGRAASDLLTVQASSHGEGEPGPSKPTLYFHVAADETTGAFTDYWTNADPNDPDDNTEGGGGSTGLSQDGSQEWPLSPAPSQNLYLTPGGVGSAKLYYLGMADPQVQVGLDVLVNGVVRASGSSTEDFLLTDFMKEVSFNVLVDGDWDGTIPTGSDVQVITYYRTATGGWQGHIEYEFGSFELTLPWATGPGGGGGGGDYVTERYYGHDIDAGWVNCKGNVVGLDQSPPTGEESTAPIWLLCDQGVDITMATSALTEPLEVSASAASQVTTYVGTLPFTDFGASLPQEVTVSLGTLSQPTLLGTTTVLLPTHVNDIQWVPIVIDVQPAADTLLPAGSSLAVKIGWNQPVTGYYGTPYSSYGGGENAPYMLDLQVVDEDDPVDPPGNVTGLAATEGDTQVTLDWDVNPDAVSYKVYRDGSEIASPTAVTYTDTGLTNDVTYTYEVTAIGSTGLESAKGDAVDATPTGSSIPEKVELTVRSAADSTIVLPTTQVTGIASWSQSWDTTTVADGDYIATAVYTATDGRQASTNVAFSVNNIPDIEPPTVSLSASVSEAGPGEGIDFTAAATDGGGTLTYAWDFGDGTTIADGAALETHAFAETGFFTARVTVTNEAGSDSDTVDLVILDDRYVEVRIVPGNAAPSEGGWSEANPTGPGGSWATWDYAWDATGLRGPFDIEARFFDGFGLNDPIMTSVSVGSNPTASLVATPDSVDLVTSVTLDGSGSAAQAGGSIVEYRFDAGDGSGVTITTDSSIVHNYGTPGAYTATLVVVDELGLESDAASAAVTVTNTAPVAIADVPAGPVPTSTPLLFTGSSSYDPDGFIASYAWDFGDGNTANIANPTHLYADDGVYTVTLTVTDDLGATGEATGDVTVLNRAPRATFGVTPALEFTSVDRLLSGLASTDADGTIANYAFTLGDGSPDISGAAPTANHDYPTAGVFIASLTVTDDDGADSAPELFEVTVKNRPVDIGDLTNQVVLEDSQLDLTILASDPEGAPVAITMDSVPDDATFIDNGDGSASFSWTTDFFDSGVYPVTVRATDGEDDGETVANFAITVVNVDRPAYFTQLEAHVWPEQFVRSAFVSATDDDLEPVTLSVNAADLPDGATFSNLGGGEGRLNWQPQLGDEGVYLIPITATSNGVAVTEIMKITVAVVMRHDNGPAINAAPGQEVQLRARMTNLNDEAETFTFGASSAQGWDLTVPDPVTVAPGESTVVTMLATVPDGATTGQPRLTATTDLDPGQLVKLTWGVDIPIVLDVEFTQDPSLLISPTGWVHASYLDGSPVEGMDVEVTQTPSQSAALRSSLEAEERVPGSYFFNFKRADHPSAALPGTHTLFVEMERANQRFDSVTTSYTISVV